LPGDLPEAHWTRNGAGLFSLQPTVEEIQNAIARENGFDRLGGNRCMKLGGVIIDQPSYSVTDSPKKGA
jgi:hypothetical protein